MMRYGAFTACDLVSYGQRLLRHGVDRSDCVAATVRALDLLADGQPLFGRYIVMPAHPWTADDAERLGGRWRDILARSDPASVALVERYGIEMPRSVARHDPASTREGLGFVPSHNFGTFLAELREKDSTGAVSPDSPRWCFETGRPPTPGIVWPAQEPGSPSS